MIRILSLLCLFSMVALLGTTTPLFAEPVTIPLWPDGAPGAVGSEPKDIPTLTIHTPEGENRTETAVVVCPGGGYGHLATGHEGIEIGKWLSGHGVTAIVLEYRHRGRGYGHPAPLQDAQRAIRTVRAHAAKYEIDPAKIGILGFSAGGHLASTAGTKFDSGNPDVDDPIEKASSRPDFMILCYPVIAFGQPFTHRGSQDNLLGKEASEELVDQFSNEKQVTSETPPTFLFHTHEDTAVPPENSVHFYLALKEAGVPAEMHLFEKGRHGVGLARQIPGTSAWPDLCLAWLKGRGML